MSVGLRIWAAGVAGMIVLAIPPGAASAQELSGPARAIEADVIAIGQQRIALFGVESVEPPQRCSIDRQLWECYPAAVRALENIISVANVTCTQIGNPDPFGRLLGVCTVAGENVNEALVRSGFALAKRDETLDYVPAEDAAKAEGIGLWQGAFQHPKAFRESQGIDIDRP